MIDSFEQLQEIMRYRFDFGVKHQEILGDRELMLSARQEKLVEVMEYLSRSCGGRLVGQVINDLGNRMELVEIVSLDHLRARVYIKVGIDIRDKTTMTATGSFDSARWLEKLNNHEQGIRFVAWEEKEITPDKIPATSGPMLPWIPLDIDDQVDKRFFPENIGIFDRRLDHATYLWGRVSRNRVLDVKCRLGQFPRGLARIFRALDLRDLPRVLARICWADRFSIQLAGALAIERLAGIDGRVSTFSSSWRAIACELERIYNHHRFLASMMSLGGYPGLARKNLAVLEPVKRLVNSLFEDDSGVPFIVPGGISRNPVSNNPLGLRSLGDTLMLYENEIAGTLVKPMIDDSVFSSYEGLAVVDTNAAVLSGIQGPALRASGYCHDARVDFPTGIFKTGLVRFDVPHATTGDVRARVEVHLFELLQSLRIIYQLLDLIDDETGGGQVEADMGLEDTLELDPNKHAVVVVESSRGPLLAHGMVNPTVPKLQSFNIQAPSFLTFTALEKVLHGFSKRDMGIIVQSFNPCWQCIDQGV